MRTDYRVASVEYDGNEYLRRALIDLGKDVRTPKDIFESKFDEPKLENRQVIALKGVARLNYSAEVGTDRKVDTVTERGATVTKTVTDWHPVSGQYSVEAFGFAENCTSPDASESPLIANAVRTCKNYVEYDGDEDTPEPLEPCTAAISAAKADGFDEAKVKCRSNIGTRVRNFKCDGYVEPTLVAAYVMPRYSMEYEYKGEKYTRHAYAAGKFKSGGTLPDEAERIEARTDRRMLPLFIASIVLSVISAIFSIIGVSSTDYDTLVSALVPVQVFFVLASLTFICNKFAVKIFRHVAYKVNFKAKKADLIAKLSQLGLRSPTDEELKGFKVGTHSGDVKAPRRRVIPTVAYAVCCIPFAFKLFSHLFEMMFSLVFVFILLIGVVAYNVGLTVYRVMKIKEAKSKE